MKDIIVKLAEKAAEHAVLNSSESVLQSESDDSKVEIPAEFISKFSELIVQECIKEIGYKSVELLDIDFYPHYQERLKKYFGVK